METQTKRDTSMPTKSVTRQGSKGKTSNRKVKDKAGLGDAKLGDVTEAPSHVEGEGNGSNTNRNRD